MSASADWRALVERYRNEPQTEAGRALLVTICEMHSGEWGGGFEGDAAVVEKGEHWLPDILAIEAEAVRDERRALIAHKNAALAFVAWAAQLDDPGNPVHLTVTLGEIAARAQEASWSEDEVETLRWQTAGVSPVPASLTRIPLEGYRS